MIKTTTQYSYELTKEQLTPLNELGKRYRIVRNYLYQKYSTIYQIGVINNFYDLRNQLMKEKPWFTTYLPARYWKICLQQTLGNIKSNWQNDFNQIRMIMNQNFNLTDEDIHYLNTLLKSYKTLDQVLNKNQESDYLKEKFSNVNRHRMNNLLKRYIRKYKSRRPYSKKSNLLHLDSGLYQYKKQVIQITSLVKRKRINIPVKDTREFTNTLTVKWSNNIFTIYAPIEIKPKINTNKIIIGVDKGYSSLLTTSTGNKYGIEYKQISTPYIDKQLKKNKNRSRLYQLYRNYLEKGNLYKANQIYTNNLGKLKYNNYQHKHNETLKAYINHSINQLIENERPKEIVKEDLTWVGNKNQGSKQLNNRLNQWMKGYLDERLEFKAELNGVKITEVNPAYTSQIHHKCKTLGTRKYEDFYCSKCNKHEDADINAAKNILARKYETQITKYTAVKTIKQYYDNKERSNF